MGADIHIYVKAKCTLEGETYWETMLWAIDPGRDYSKFAILAGVRNYDDVTPVPSLPWSDKDIKQLDPDNNFHSRRIISGKQFVDTIGLTFGPWGALSAWIAHMLLTHEVEVLMAFDN